MHMLARIHTTLGCILVVLGALAHAQSSKPLAPDGQRGLGASTPLGELQKLLRKPGAKDKPFLVGLAALESEVRVLAALARTRYAERGYFTLVADGAEDLASLHAAFEQLDERSIEALRGEEVKALAFARMYFDLRFRMRMRVLETFEEEARDLRAGLTLLRATYDGYVVLDRDVARRVTGRVDLAASVLRAIQSDLLALQVPDGVADFDERDEAKARGLFEVARAAAGADQESERAFEVARWGEEVASAEQRMDATLATSKLLVRAAKELAERAAAIAQAEKLLAQVNTWMPARTEGAKTEGNEVPAEVQRMSKSQRIRMARNTAVAGLALDPFDEDLAYLTASTADFFDGRQITRPYYDHYLALRGIRAHDHRTFATRTLTDRDQDALDEVQGTTPER